MSHHTFRRISMFLCLAAVFAASASIARAGPPSQGERWLPLGGSTAPLAPDLIVAYADATTVELEATLPGVFAAEVSLGGTTYTRLYGPGYGHSREIGRPDLPVLRGDVEIPFGAAVTPELVEAAYQDLRLEELGLFPIYPLQPPQPKVAGAEQPSAVDRAFYRSAARYPASPLALGESYIVRGHRVQRVEVYPVAYNAAAGTVRFYSQVRFRLRLEGSDMEHTRLLAERYASPAFEPTLSRQILNYNQGRPAARFAPDAPIGYLIITADAYEAAMAPFVTLKESRGFDVTMVSCSDIGGCASPSNIQNYIVNAYNNWPLPPSYVLLVGDTDTVATWTGPAIGTSTDLYYGCMDGSGDWHPDIGRGRFPVRSTAQTTAMVNKYLAYAVLTGNEPWLKKASFPATCDQYQIAEGTHNYVINSYTAPGGWTGNFPSPNYPGGDKLYCITYNAQHSDLVNMFNQGRWAIIYSGHGSYNGWEMDFTPQDVRNLTSYGAFPFVASHACLSGDFGQTEVFGETWVLQENKGALVYWGSSTLSYWGEDDVLERAMFDSLFAPTTPHADVATMTDYGLSAVESAYPDMGRYYRETYNVLGDPAVKIFLEPDLPTFTMNIEPAAHEVCQSGTVTSSVVIGSIMGYSKTVMLTHGPLPPGVSATFAPAAAPAPYTATLTLAVAPGTPAGNYTLVITASDGLSWTQDSAVNLRVVPGAAAAPALVSPPDGAANQPLQPTFDWDAATFARTYHLQADHSPLFAAPLLDVASLVDTAYTPPVPLPGGRCYWWRVQGENACGSGPWTAAYHFATVALAVGFADDIESGEGQWNKQVAQGTAQWTIVTSQSHSPTHAWFVLDDSKVTDSRLWNKVAVPVGPGSTLTFWHRYGFETPAYDGGILEISLNNGQSWSDLGPYITSGGYNGIISTCCGNPLGGRQAWVGNLSQWTRVTVNLSAFAGNSVMIRWRIGCDSSISAEGWYVDDVQITSPLPPNPAPLLTAIVPDHGKPTVPTSVQILGRGFVETPSAQLGETWLLSVTLASSTTLEAVVPAGMSPGTYTLTLYNGDCQEAALPNAFTVEGCAVLTVTLSSDSPVELGQPVHFTATVAGGSPPYSYTWDMGGPGYGVGLDTATPVYTYTAAGDYTATVAVSYDDCLPTTATISVQVTCESPQASFVSDSPVYLGQAMHFTSTVRGTGPLTYTWDFGDGIGWSHEENPSYTYAAAGDYTVTLAVTGPCGTATYTATVTVRPEEPTYRIFLPIVFHVVQRHRWRNFP